MIEDALYSRLTSDAGVSGIVSARVYPVILAQDAIMPSITYLKVSDSPVIGFGGENSRRNARFQIDCWTTTYSDVKSLEDAIKLAMVDGPDFSTVRITSEDLYDNDMKLFRVSTDFSVWY